MKRIKLFPLIVLLWCAGISLSSGLYFYEIYSALYLIPIGLIMGVYYVLCMLFARFKRNALAGLGGTMILSLLGFLLLKKVLVPSFALLFNTVSHRIFASYGISLGNLQVTGEGSEALAIAQLVAFVTAISLYLYETHRPAFVTALPSFVLFIISIAADGVPYEMCVIAYAGALILFLGMGRSGESLSKFILLLSCIAVTVVIVRFAFSWTDVSEKMWEYRNQITESLNGNGSGSGAGKGTGSEPSEKDQTIDFGQFNKQGDISYNGTIELYVKSDEARDGEQLFLRGYIGTYYGDSQWSGRWLDGDGEDTEWDTFAQDSGIEVKNAFDRGNYIPVMMRPEDYGDLKRVRLDTEDLDWWDMDVDPEMKERILKEIVRDQKHKTVGDVINIVKNYFGEGFQYTLQPGKLVDGVDEVEHFLFTRKTGYCTHFASAAVMILRSMGIEARLAEGYMVNGNRIRAGKETNVYDYNAHAWVEVFIYNDEKWHGWLPLDVTSYVLGDLSEGNPIGAERGDIAKEQEKQKMEKKEKEEVKKEEDRESGHQKGELWSKISDAAKVLVDEKMTWENGWIVLGFVIVIVTASCLTVVLLRWSRSRKMRKQMRIGSYGKRLLFVNDSLSGFWHEAGVPWDYSDSIAQTQNIWRKTGKYYPSFSNRECREQIYRYVLSVYKCRFGNEDMDKETYEADIGYLSELILGIKKDVDKKKWKKFRKCSMVKIIEKMEESSA